MVNNLISTHNLHGATYIDSVQRSASDERDSEKKISPVSQNEVSSPDSASSDESGLWQISPAARGVSKGKGKDQQDVAEDGGSEGKKGGKTAKRLPPSMSDMRAQWSATGPGPSERPSLKLDTQANKETAEAKNERLVERFGTTNQALRHPQYYPNSEDSPAQEARYEAMRAAGPSRAITPGWRSAAEKVSRENSRAVREAQAAGSSVRDFAYEGSSAQHKDPGAREPRPNETIPQLPRSFLAVNSVQSKVDQGLIPPGLIFLTHEQLKDIEASRKAAQTKFGDPDDVGNSMGGRIDRGEGSSFR